MPTYTIEGNKAYLPFFQSREETCVLYGGAGSGKSYAAASKFIARLTEGRYERFYAFRKVAATIGDSIWPLLKWAADAAGIVYKTNESRRELVCLTTGSMIMCRGLDKVDKLKSLMSATSVWVEEADQITEQDWLQLQARVRGTAPTYKQFVLTFNPVDESSWLKKFFFDTIQPNTFVIHTTYLQNKWVDESDVRRYENWKLFDENFYNVYCMGHWGNPNKGGEFYKGYSVARNTDKGLSYDPYSVLHLSFDENVHPYMTCTVSQTNGKHVRQIDEILLRDPRNTVKAVCEEVLFRYRDHKGTVRVYGDPSMKKEDAKLEKGENAFNLIRKYLEPLKPTLHNQPSAPSIAMRGRFISELFMGFIPECSFTIDKAKCPESAAEYSMVKEDHEGKKLKKMVEDKRTGIRYQQYGHVSDANDYFLCTILATEYAEFQRGGKVVAPVMRSISAGRRRVL